MTRKELKEHKLKRDMLFNKIINKGKVIAESTINKQNKYILLDNTIWYYPYGSHPSNCGTLVDFTRAINKSKIKAKFIDNEINK